MSTLAVLRPVGRAANRKLESGAVWIRPRPPPASSSHAVAMTCLTTVTVVLGAAGPPAPRAPGLWCATGIPRARPDPLPPTRYLICIGVGHTIRRGFSSSTARCTRSTELSSSRLTSSARSALASWTWSASLTFTATACLLGVWRCLETRCPTAFPNTSASSSPNPCPTWMITRCPRARPPRGALRPEPAVAASLPAFRSAAFPSSHCLRRITTGTAEQTRP